MIELAAKADSAAHQDPRVARLSRVSKDEDWMASEIAESLASTEPDATDESVKTKLFLILMHWAYFKRMEFERPEFILDEICAQFDYPMSARHLLSFNLPQQGAHPNSSDRAEFLSCLFHHWNAFLGNAE